MREGDITINPNEPVAKELRKRIERGAKWLDEVVPGWESRIDIDTLDLDNSMLCICGQVFKEMLEGLVYSGYTYAVGLLEEANSWLSTLVPQSEDGRGLMLAIALGFEAGKYSYLELTIGWKQFLKERAAG